MKQQREDLTSKWITIDEYPFWYINCENCAHTIKKINIEEDIVYLHKDKDDLPNNCPVCRRKMINGVDYIKEEIMKLKKKQNHQSKFL